MRALASFFSTGLAVCALALVAGCGDNPETTSTGGGGTTATGGSGGTGGGQACEPGPSEIASTQSVNVDVQNTTATDRFVLMDCHECETFRVESQGELDYVLVPVVLLSADLCGCECPSPPPAYPLAYHRIPAGESFTVVWDARTLALCVAQEDCGGGTTADVPKGALQPVAPGAYRLSYGIVEMLPPECTQVAMSDDFTCTEPATPGIDPGGGFFPVEFTLPQMGDLDVALTLQ